jgi:predicted PurR-regulated permease PerM
MTSPADSSRLLRLVLLGAGLVVIGAGLRAAAPTVNLVLVSLVLAMTVYPISHVLTKRGMGRGLAVLITLLAVLIGGVLLMLVLAKSLSRLVQEAPKYAPAFAAMIDSGERFLAARGVEVQGLPKPDPQRILGIVQRFASAALGALGNSIFVLILIAMFLAEMPLHKAGSKPDGWSARVEEVGKGIRLFVGINGILGAAAAVINFVVMLALGTDFPVIWAVLSFLFAFVPFGFLISLVPPFVVTLLEQGGGKAALLFVLFVGINIVFDNVVKPKVMGQGLGISPLVIILSLMAWMFVLGPVGALLAIPLTIALSKILPLLTEEAPGAVRS